MPTSLPSRPQEGDTSNMTEAVQLGLDSPSEKSEPAYPAQGQGSQGTANVASRAQPKSGSV